MRRHLTPFRYEGKYLTPKQLRALAPEKWREWKNKGAKHFMEDTPAPPPVDLDERAALRERFEQKQAQRQEQQVGVKSGRVRGLLRRFFGRKI